MSTFMSENQTYALWIIPGDNAYTLTSGYINKLSEAYHVPRFEPHVTVLAGISLPESSEMRALTGSMTPFRIRFAREVEYLDEVFRCLFLRAHPTAELMDAIAKAGALFGDQGKPEFPHLSLAYGNLPVETKHAMIRDLGPIPEIEFVARALSLIHGSTEMPVASWRVVERFVFANP